MPKLTAIVTADIKDFKEKMSEVGATTKAAAALAVTAIAAMSTAVAKLGYEAVKSASDFEDLESKLKIILGDSQKGAQIFADIRKEVSKLPIDSKSGIEAFSSLIALAGEDVALDQWKNITAIAQSLGQNASVAATQVGNMMLKLKTGAGTGSIIETLGSQEVSKIFGQNTQKLIQMARAGTKAEDMLKAMNDALRTQGEFALAEMSSTRRGKESTLGGLISEKLAQAGSDALKEYKKILDSLISTIEKFDMSKMNESFGRFTAMIGEFVQSGFFKDLVNLMVDGIPIIVDMFTVFGGAAQSLVTMLWPLVKILQALVWAYTKLQELVGWASENLIPNFGTEQGAPSESDIEAQREAARLRREADKRILANYPPGPILT